MNQNDINKLFQCIAADFRMIVKKTGLWQQNQCDNILSDLKLFMNGNYLSQICIILDDTTQGVNIRCNKYIINDTTIENINDRPGDNDWDNLGGNNLHVVVSYSKNWTDLLDYHKNEFRKNLMIQWSPVSIDLNFPILKSNNKKNYISTGGSVKRIDYTR